MSKETTMIDIDGLRTSLQPAAEMLAADGYELSVTHNGDRARVEVIAGPEACADCLVPHDLMLDILHQMIDPTETKPTVPIDLVYPTDTAH
jgi:hypothetical protein